MLKFNYTMMQQWRSCRLIYLGMREAWKTLKMTHWNLDVICQRAAPVFSISHLTSVWVLLGKTFLVYFYFFLVYFIHQGTILLLSLKCYFCKAIETTILLYDWFYNFVYCSKLFCLLQSLCVWLTVSLKLCEWGSLYYSKL